VIRNVAIGLWLAFFAFLGGLYAQAPTSPSTENLQKKDVQVKNELKKAPPPEKMAAEPKKDHLIVLINMSNYQVRKARINKGAWFPTPAISRTCPYNDYDKCFDEHKWANLLMVQCEETIQIDVGMIDAAGVWWQTGWPSFKPDCAYAGTAIGLGPY